MRIKETLIVVVLFGSLFGVPTRAYADAFFVPYLGWTFDSKYGPAELNSKMVYGADIMWVGTSGVGFEVDFAYHPNFFEPGDDEEFFDFDSDGNVVTFMGNLVFGYQGGGIQPYVVGGFGLMRTNISDVGGLFDDFSDSAWGVNAGGGLRLGGRKFGVRGDVRYFRQLSDIEFGDLDANLADFSYWRGTIGLAIGF